VFILVFAVIQYYRFGRTVTEEQIAADVRAAVDATVADFAFPQRNHEQGAWILLDSQSTSGVSPADVISAISVVDEYWSKSRRLPEILELSVYTTRPEPVIAEWSKQPDDSGVRLVRIDGLWDRYDESFGRWPALRGLGTLGPGSDFSRIGECNPNLETLVIGSWEESNGYEGLNDVHELRWLEIGGEVRNIGDLPLLANLEYLRLHLSEDTPANREKIQDRFPDCEIEFSETPLDFQE
jgi:hypothetical protein